MTDGDGGGGASARLQQLFEGHRLTPTQRRIAHCMVRAGGGRALPVERGAGRTGRGQPAVGDPLRRRPRLRRLSGAAQASARGRPRRATSAERAVAQRVPAGRPGRDREPAAPGGAARRPRARCGRAGRLLAASRPLPVLGLRAAASQARGFAYFAAKVHPDVRLLDEGGSMLADRIDAARQAGATRAAVLRAAPPPARGRRHPGVRPGGRADRGDGRRLGRSRRSPRHSDLLLPAAVGTGLAFDTACAPMLLGRVLLEAMCDDLPDAQARLEEFDARAAARGLFVE